MCQRTVARRRTRTECRVGAGRAQAAGGDAVPPEDPWPGGEWKEGEEEEAWYGDDLIDGESLVLGGSGNHVRGDRDLGYYEADGNGGC